MRADWPETDGATDCESAGMSVTWSARESAPVLERASAPVLERASAPVLETGEGETASEAQAGVEKEGEMVEVATAVVVRGGVETAAVTEGAERERVMGRVVAVTEVVGRVAAGMVEVGRVVAVTEVVGRVAAGMVEVGRVEGVMEGGVKVEAKVLERTEQDMRAEVLVYAGICYSSTDSQGNNCNTHGSASCWQLRHSTRPVC